MYWTADGQDHENGLNLKKKIGLIFSSLSLLSVGELAKTLIMVYFLLENSLDIFLLVDDTLINCVFFFYYDSKRISGNCSFLVHFKNMTGLFVGRAYGLMGWLRPCIVFLFQENHRKNK